jgi:hypothetical protein
VPRPLVVSDDRCAVAPIVLSLEAIMPALRLVALALSAFRRFSQVFDLTSGPIVQGWGRVIRHQCYARIIADVQDA